MQSKQCHCAHHTVYLSIPDVGTGWSLEHKAVIGVERRGLLFHLHSPGVKLIGAPYLEQPGSINVIAICVCSVLEGTGFSSRVQNHLALEYQQEVIWFLVLHHTHLHCTPTKLIINLNCLESRYSSLILAGLLQSTQ